MKAGYVGKSLAVKRTSGLRAAASLDGTTPRRAPSVGNHRRATGER